MLTVERAALIVVVALGIVLRFVSTSPLWLDEALAVNVSALALDEIPGALGRDGLPPLYYWLLHGWMQLFGDGDVAVRSLAGLISVGTLPLMYVAGRRLAGVTVGWVAVALLALNPYALRYANEARMYSLVMLLVLVGFLLVESGRRSSSWWPLVGTALVTTALLWTHYWSFWLLGAVVVVLGWEALRADEPLRHRSRRLTGAVFVGGLGFLPWLPTFLEQAAHTATPWAQASRPTQLVATTIEDFGGFEIAEAKLLGLALVVLALLGVFGRARGSWRIELDLRTVPRTRLVALVVVLTAALGAGVSLLTDNAFASRYASVFFPLFLLLVAVGVTRVTPAGGRDLVLAAVLVLGAGVAVHNAASDRTQAGELAAAIEAGTEAAGMETPVVAYCPDQLGPSVSRLLPDEGFDQVVFPELDSDAVEVPERVDWYDYERRHADGDPPEFAQRLVERAGTERAIWVVSSSGYRTVEEECPAVVEELARLRPGRPVVAEAGDRYFEHGALHLFPATEP